MDGLSVSNPEGNQQMLYPTLTVIDYSVFKITFSIQSHVTDPLPLMNEDCYNFMICNTAKIKKDPSVKIIVTEQPRKVSTAVSLT